MLHQKPASSKNFVAACVSYVRPHQTFLVWPCGVLVAVADFTGLCGFDTCCVVYIVARDVYERDPSLVGAEKVVDGDRVPVVCTVAHGAVVTVPVKVWPAKNHVSRFMHKNIQRKFPRHVCHLVVRDAYTVLDHVARPS